MTTNEPDNQDHDPVTAHVTFEGGEDLPILFANHIFVRLTPDGFMVSFAQSHGPYRLDLTPEQVAQLGIPAKIITRLLIPHARMKEMVELLNNIVDKVDINVKFERQLNDDDADGDQ